VAGSAVRLGFVACLAGTLLLMDPQFLFYGMPLGVRIACGLALVALALDAVALFAFLRRPKNAVASAAAFIYFGSTGVFLWWLSYWNLLGWQTG
jgi:hypothetical protein